MEVISIESKAYQELMAKINTIAKFVSSHQPESTEVIDWVDTSEVCRFLQISERTLLRLRSKNLVSYSKIGGRNYYKISEIKRLLDSRLIRSTEAHYQEMIRQHQANRQKH